MTSNVPNETALASAVVRSDGNVPPELRVILRGVIGSAVHGLSVGGDDTDHMGVAVEPPERVIGLSPFSHYQYRTAETRQPQKGGVAPRSQAGDLDLMIYGLRRYVGLAAQGNPSIITLMYTPPYALHTLTESGMELRTHAHLFATKQAGARFLGYMKGQKARLLGEQGQKDVKRPELVEQYGFDTKYAGHLLRLGYQGIQYMQHGHLVLPMLDEQRVFLIAVRQGKYALDEVVEHTEHLEGKLKSAILSSRLPDRPDYAAIDALLVRLYKVEWENMDIKRAGDVIRRIVGKLHRTGDT